MTHQTGDSRLIDLGKTNLLRWLFWLVWNWGLIVLCLTLIHRSHSWFVWIPVVIVIGSRQHALAILGHDGTHYLASKCRPLNDFLTNIFCFLPFGANLNSYRAVHLEHHNHLGTDKDPELDFKKEMAPQWDLPITRKALLLRFFKDMLAFGFRDVIIIMKSMPIRRIRDYVYLIIFWFSLVSVLWACGKLWVIPIWFIALFAPQWAFFRLRIWTEHLGTKGTHRLRSAWWQRWFFLPHNTWYHYEHHKWPWIPFHNLPKARLTLDEPKTISFSGLTGFLSCAH